MSAHWAAAIATADLSRRVRAAVRPLRAFIGAGQLDFIQQLCQGEEGEWFVAKLEEMAGIVASMPKTYDQRSVKAADQLVSLHYFTGGCDWWITEKDKGDPDDAPEERGQQHQAFGFTDIGHGAEADYISIAEIIAHGAEIDLHFPPRPAREVRRLAGRLGAD
jgi:hypothetical protein